MDKLYVLVLLGVETLFIVFGALVGLIPHVPFLISVKVGAVFGIIGVFVLIIIKGGNRFKSHEQGLLKK